MFDRNYEEDEPDPLAQAIVDLVNAPGGCLEEFSKKMDAIPKVIVPKDKENYEYLLGRCDEFAKSVITAKFMVSLTLSIGTPTST